MKARRFFLVIFIVLCFTGLSARADTNVGGVISADATWTVAAGPYVVVSDLMVANNATLSIDPGVEVRFQPDTTLDISLGKLVARGVEGNMIRFTANATGPITDVDRWGYIKFSNGSVDATFDASGNYLDGSILEYATVEYGEGTEGGGGSERSTIYINQAAPYIADSLIQHNNSGLYASYVDGLRLERNTFTANDGVSAIRLNYTSNIALSHNILNGNDTLSGLRLYAAPDTTLTGDRITNNAGTGILVSYTHTPGAASSDFVLSADENEPSWIFGNELYNVYNYMSFPGSFLPSAPHNIDARNVWWGTTDMAEIAEGIYDYMDDNSKGIVFFDPYFVPLPGDINLDGWVGEDDLTTIIANWGQTGLGRAGGDLNDNGIVDGPDYSEVISYWNPEPAEPTPEPTTLILLILGGLLALRRRQPFGFSDRVK